MLTYNYLDIPRPTWTSGVTPETIYNDLLTFATAFITIDSRLSILEDISGLRGDYGAVVYIGFADEGIPILAFNNYYENSSYYYQYLFCSVLSSNYYPYMTTSTGYIGRAVSWNVGTSWQGTSIRVKFLLFKDVLSFDFGTNVSTHSETNYARFFITRIISPVDGTPFAHNCFIIYRSYVYCSVSASPGGVSTFNLLMYNNHVGGRYYMLECGLNETMYILENIYYFSGTKTNYRVCQRFIFNDEEYQTLGEGEYDYQWRLCAKV